MRDVERRSAAWTLVGRGRARAESGDFGGAFEDFDGARVLLDAAEHPAGAALAAWGAALTASADDPAGRSAHFAVLDAGVRALSAGRHDLYAKVSVVGMLVSAVRNDAEGLREHLRAGVATCDFRDDADGVFDFFERGALLALGMGLAEDARDALRAALAVAEGMGWTERGDRIRERLGRVD